MQRTIYVVLVYLLAAASSGASVANDVIAADQRAAPGNAPALAKPSDAKKVLKDGPRSTSLGITPADCRIPSQCTLYCPGGQGTDPSGKKFCWGKSCVITEFGLVCD
jgi:hypothetical protein